MNRIAVTGLGAISALGASLEDNWQAAVAGRGETLKLLAVTVLTSFDEQDVLDDGSAFSLADLVERRVGHAMAAGVNGIVCSSLEVSRVRAMTGPKMTLVIPGVRSAGKSTGDQKRVATPAEAIRNGADYLVVGRPITQAPDPRAAAEAIVAEIGQAH